MGRPVVAVMAAEIGGGNGILPISWAARMGLPVVDADAMGRAFPEVQQQTMEIAGVDPSPCVMTDERGNRLVIRTTDGHWLERLARAAAVEFGGTASSAEYPMTAARAREATVRGSVSRALLIGRALEAPDDPVRALGEAIGAVLLLARQADGRRAPRGGRLRPRIGDRRGAGGAPRQAAAAGDPEREPGRPRGRRPPAGDGAGHHHRARRGDRPRDPHRAAPLRPAGVGAWRSPATRCGARRGRTRSWPGRGRSATTSATSPWRSCPRDARRSTCGSGIDVGGTNTDAVVLDRADAAGRQGQAADHAPTSAAASPPRSTPSSRPPESSPAG